MVVLIAANWWAGTATGGGERSDRSRVSNSAKLPFAFADRHVATIASVVIVVLRTDVCLKGDQTRFLTLGELGVGSIDMIQQADSGIEAIGSIPWGTHFCQFYETPEDMIDTIVPYFKAGIDGGARCFWVAAPPLGAVEATNALRNAVPDIDQRIERGEMEIVDHDQWAIKQSAQSVDEILAFWMQRKDDALDNGYAGLRVTGNLNYVTSDTWDIYEDYERKAITCFCNENIIALCSYCTSACDAGMAIDVVQNHDFALARRRGSWTMIETAATKRTKHGLAAANDVLEVQVARRTADLAEKNLLLKEGYHRFKNNLQVVSALIQLRATRSKDPAIRAAFAETLQRIGAMSLVHETLYKGTDTSRINFTAYLRSIAETSAASYGMADRIEVRVEDNPDGVESKDAVPLGLAAVEAITNAFKHAFPDGRRGKLSISFQASKPDQEGELIIRDDGIGTPDHPTNGPRGAGLSLAAALARQVGGRITTENDHGTVWRLCFAGAPEVTPIAST
jgi:two-component sensor histidine kinase